jgi:outer membrane receptor protein involved in Fe transport
MPTRSILALLVLACAVSITSAQHGSLTVKVTDKNGDPLPGATVTIRHPQHYIAETSLTSDAEGIVEFPVLRATGVSGVGYVLEVSMPGFGVQRIPDVKIRINERLRRPIQLSEELLERVKTVATGEVVNLETTQSATRFSDDFVQDLPVPGRFYQNVLSLAPGVQDDDGDGNVTVHGSRDRDFKAVVSGISNVDPLTGRQMSQVNPNSIEEMEVITAGAGVEFGRAQGGFARILQKQGSNDFEGVVELYYRSSALDGDGATTNTSIPAFEPDFDSFQPSVQVSGPVIKDKLWYRLSHEWIDSETPINVISGIAIVTESQGIHSDQLTWQVSPRNKLAFQFSMDPYTVENFGVSSITPPESSIRYEQGSEVYQLTWTAPVSPKVLVDSQVAWQDQNVKYGPTVSGQTNDCTRGPAFIESAYCFNGTTGEVSGSFPTTHDDHRQRLTIQSTATLYAGSFLGMSHELKLGTVVENERYERYLENRPQFDFFIYSLIDNSTSGDEEVEPLGLSFGSISVPPASNIDATGTNWALFAQDQLKPLQNLSVTLGLRVDREEIDSTGAQPFDPEAEAAQYHAALAGGGSSNHLIQSRKEAFTAFPNLADFFSQLDRIIGLRDGTSYNNSSVAAYESGGFYKKRGEEDIRIGNTNWSPQLSVSWDPWSDGKTKLVATARRFYDKIFLAIRCASSSPPRPTWCSSRGSRAASSA